MHFEQVILAITGVLAALIMSGCQLTIGLNPLDTVDHKQTWEASEKRASKGGK